MFHYNIEHLLSNVFMKKIEMDPICLDLNQ